MISISVLLKFDSLITYRLVLQELQHKLTEMESEMHDSHDPFQGGSHLFGSPIELTLKKGEREKQLEILVSLSHSDAVGTLLSS